MMLHLQWPLLILDIIVDWIELLSAVRSTNVIWKKQNEKKNLIRKLLVLLFCLVTKGKTAGHNSLMDFYYGSIYILNRENRALALYLNIHMELIQWWGFYQICLISFQ